MIAALNPACFSTLLASVNYTPDMWSAIAHEDGTLFLREPAQRGRSGVAEEVFLPQRKLAWQMEEVLTGRGNPAEGERQTAVLAIRSDVLTQDSVLYVLASRELNALYAPWYREARLLTFSHGLILVLLVLGIRP